MQSLNVIQLTTEQFEKVLHKLPNYTMVNCDLLKENIQQIDENNHYSVPTWLMILIIVLGTIIAVIGIATYYHC